MKPLMTTVVGRLLRITNSKYVQGSDNTYTYEFTKKGKCYKQSKFSIVIISRPC